MRENSICVFSSEERRVIFLISDSIDGILRGFGKRDIEIY
jgi:hypothetical protein